MNLDPEYVEMLRTKAHRFDPNLIEPSNNILAVSRTIYSQLGIEEIKSYKIKRWEDNLNLVLMNLYIAYKRELNLSYCMSVRFYPLKFMSLKNKVFFSIKKINKIFEYLESLNYVKIYKGYRNRKIHIGYATRIELRPNLKQHFKRFSHDYFKSDFKTEKSIILRRKKVDELSELNSLRDWFKEARSAEKRKININKIEKNLEELNEFYNNSKISVLIPISVLENQSERIVDILLKTCVLNGSVELLNGYIDKPNVDNVSDISKNFSKVDIYTNSLYIYIPIYHHTSSGYPKFFSFKINNLQSNRLLYLNIKGKYLKRVFVEDYCSGGRFYGAIYQSFNKNLRKYIQINDEKTMEIDYSAMHLRMLYHSIGIDYKGDPYQTPSGKGREYFKKIALITINSTGREQCIYAIKNELSNMGRSIDLEGAEKLLDTFMNMHPKISRFFYSGKWAPLQYGDSTIMNNILKKLRESKIVGLPIHDSVIVQKKYKNFVCQVMIDCYKKIFKFEPILTF